MRTLVVYLNLMLLARFALVLVCVVAFVLGLDLIENAQGVLEGPSGGLLAVARYAVLRLPEIASESIRVACLIGVLMALTQLIRNNEMTAIWNTGLSQFGIMLYLLPAATFIGLLQFAVDGAAVPWSSAALHAWKVGAYDSDRIEIRNAARTASWFQAGTDIVRVPPDNPRLDVLKNITIFQRDGDGQLQARLEVGEARYDRGTWRLRDIHRYDVADNSFSKVADDSTELQFSPKLLQRLGTHPRNLSFAQLHRLVSGEDQGLWARHLYETWLQAKLSVGLTPIVIFFLVVALALRFQRTGHVEFLFVAGLALGFAFFIFSGVSLAMGEVGMLPPIVAGWAPLLCFAAIAGAIAFWFEETRVPAAGKTAAP